MRSASKFRRWFAVIAIAGGVATAAAAANDDSPLYSVQQVVAGKALYAAKCAACHSESLLRGPANALKGPDFAAAWAADLRAADWAHSQRTVDDLDFIIRTTMPKDHPGSLTPEEYTELTAFILHENGYQSGSTMLVAGSPRLKQAPLWFGASQESGAAAPPPLRITGEGAAVAVGTGPTQHELNEAALSTRNWLYHTHDYAGSRYVALDQINATNATQLRPVCVFQVGEDSNFQTGPIVYRGTMYITTTRSTIALDATTCKPRWRYTWSPRDREVLRNNRGVAIKDGYVVRGTSDGYLLALNAATGTLVWAVKAADAGEGETFTMAPLLFEDLVLIGPAGSENAISGWIGAFRLKDGSPVWKFHTVPGATLAGSPSWGNPQGIKLGGGAVWTPLSLDVATGELIVPVANPAPDLPANLRPGDNLYTNAALVLAVRTGALRWYKQIVPNDSHDWDLTQVSPLFQATIDGRARRLLATVGKDGILRTLDRDSQRIAFSAH